MVNNKNNRIVNQEVIISADSHVMEPPDLWVRGVSPKFRDNAPNFPEHKVGEGFQKHPGGHDPNERIKEMGTDGVSAEVLYPTLGLDLFGLDDSALQEECFRVYNNWLIEYCKVSPKRLIGIGCIPMYNPELGILELEHCKKQGLGGAIIWQAPHPDLPFYSNHYDRLWAAAQDLEMPISLHILTGHNYTKKPELRKGVEGYRGSVNLKTMEIVNALFDLIFYGILERYPGLKIVCVENEIGWMPFYFQQWDYYYLRFREEKPLTITRKPSEYLNKQIFATFFNDHVGGHNLEWWGEDNCMWSNDYPHPNSTWPNSRKIIERDLGHLPTNKRTKLLSSNVTSLYDL